MYHTPLSRLFVKYLQEYSAKIEIVPENLSWDQEEFFDEKTNTQKSHDTAPLRYCPAKLAICTSFNSSPFIEKMHGFEKIFIQVLPIYLQKTTPRQESFKLVGLFQIVYKFLAAQLREETDRKKA